MEINLRVHPNKYLEDYKLEVYDSLEEVYFMWYLQELYKRGFISRVLYQSSAFELSKGLWVHTTEQLKTKVKENRKQLFKPHEYTCDFVIYWNVKASGLVTNLLTSALHAPLIPFWGGISYIEIKADYDRNNMTRAFIINQKWVWEKHKKFVQLVKIPSFFKKSFTPNRYLKQDYRNGQRKIHFKTETANNFLKRLPYNR